MEMPTIDTNSIFQVMESTVTYSVQQQMPVARFDESASDLSSSEQDILFRLLSGGAGGLPPRQNNTP